MKTFKVILSFGKRADLILDGNYVGMIAADRIREAGTGKNLIGAFAEDEDFAFRGTFAFSVDGTTTFFGTGKLRIYDCRKMSEEESNKVFIDVFAGRL